MVAIEHPVLVSVQGKYPGLHVESVIVPLCGESKFIDELTDTGIAYAIQIDFLVGLQGDISRT